MKVDRRPRSRGDDYAMESGMSSAGTGSGRCPPRSRRMTGQKLSAKQLQCIKEQSERAVQQALAGGPEWTPPGEVGVDAASASTPRSRKRIEWELVKRTRDGERMYEKYFTSRDERSTSYSFNSEDERWMEESRALSASKFISDAMSMGSRTPKGKSGPTSRKGSSLTPTKGLFLVVSDMPGTLSDVTEALYADKTTDQHLIHAMQMENSFLDGGIIDVVETKTSEDPFRFLGLKWMAAKDSGFRSDVKRSAYFEYSGTRYDCQNRKTLFRIMGTVIPEDDEDESSQGYEHSLLIFLYRAGRHSTINVMMKGSMDLGGNGDLTRPVNRTMVWNCWKGATHIDMLAQVRRLSRTQFVDRANWVPDSDRKCCYICSKRFSALRSRHHCRACGDIMCNNCTVTFSIKMKSLSGKQEPKFCGKFCTRCLMSIKQQRSSSTRMTDPETDYSLNGDSGNRIGSEDSRAPDSAESSSSTNRISLHVSQRNSTGPRKVLNGAGLKDFYDGCEEVEEVEEEESVVRGESRTYRKSLTFESNSSQMNSIETFLNQMMDMSKKAQETYELTASQTATLHSNTNNDASESRASSGSMSGVSSSSEYMFDDIGDRIAQQSKLLSAMQTRLKQY